MASSFFLSYSRTQLNFARQLVERLQIAKLDIWFDLERLTPGVLWEKGISEGLSNCHGLILVASQASLSSLYVRREWETALAQEKPIYVVLYEAVDLPEELANAPILDMRLNIYGSFDALLRCLRDGDCDTGSLPSKRFLPPLPHSIRRLAKGLASVGLALLIPFLAVPFVQPMQEFFLRHFLVAVIMVNAGIFILWQTWRFVNHRMTSFMLSMLTGFTWAIAGIGIPFLIFYAISVLSGSPLFPLWLGGWLFLVAILSARMPLFKVSRDELYPWLLADSSIDINLGRRRIVDPKSKAESGRTFHLHFDQHDDRLAYQVNDILRAYGHTAAPISDPADYHIAIITRRTSSEMIQSLIKEYSQIIPIIAANLNLEKDFPDLAHYQLVDFRARSQKTLEGLAVFLKSPDTEQKPYGMTVLPRSLRARIYPGLDHWINKTGRSAAAGSMIIVLVVSSFVMPIILDLAYGDDGTFQSQITYEEFNERFRTDELNALFPTEQNSLPIRLNLNGNVIIGNLIAEVPLSWSSNSENHTQLPGGFVNTGAVSEIIWSATSLQFPSQLSVWVLRYRGEDALYDWMLAEHPALQNVRLEGAPGETFQVFQFDYPLDTWSYVLQSDAQAYLVIARIFTYKTEGVTGSGGNSNSADSSYAGRWSNDPSNVFSSDLDTNFQDDLLKFIQSIRLLEDS